MSPPQVGAAAGAADDDVGPDAVLVHGDLGLHADDALVEQHLVEHAPQHVPVAGVRYGGLHGLGDGAAKAPRGARVLGEDLPAHGGGLGGGGGHGRAVDLHDLPPKGLLLVAHLHHVHLAIEAEVAAGHGQGRAPLARAGLGGDALQALLLGVVSLGHGGVQLVAAGGVVALELVVDLGGGLELLLQAVGPDQGRGPVHAVEAQNVLGDGVQPGVVVQLLLYQFLAEDAGELLGRHGLVGAGIQQRCRLLLHVRPDVVPIFRHLRFFQIDLVGDFHGVFLLGFVFLFSLQ